MKSESKENILAYLRGNYLNSFVDSLKNINITEVNEISIRELRSKKEWEDWSRKIGVYLFIADGKVVYIGRALNSLGSRVHNQITSLGDSKWNAIITNDDNTVVVICIEGNMRYLASALEIYLIDSIKPRPRFNKRIQ